MIRDRDKAKATKAFPRISWQIFSFSESHDELDTTILFKLPCVMHLSVILVEFRKRLLDCTQGTISLPYLTAHYSTEKQI